MRTKAAGDHRPAPDPGGSCPSAAGNSGVIDGPGESSRLKAEPMPAIVQFGQGETAAVGVSPEALEISCPSS